MENSNNTGKVMSALLIGAAVGGTLGILFAPAKGSKTRKIITGKSEDLTDKFKEQFNEFLDQMKQEVEMIKNKTNEFKGNGAIISES